MAEKKFLVKNGIKVFADAVIVVNEECKYYLAEYDFCYWTHAL